MMNQRTCSHRLSELYAEIILKDKFKQEFSIQESFYNDNLFITVFRDHNFKSKLLVVNKNNQNILFENIIDASYVINNNLKDEFLYLIDPNNSILYRLKNPILKNGELEVVGFEKHMFISISKTIKDIIVKDDVIYFSVEIDCIKVKTNTEINLSLTRESNYLTAIDQISNCVNIERTSILISIDGIGLNEIDRNYFTSDFSGLKIIDGKINRKNTILIAGYVGYFMEDISYLVDSKNKIVKTLHPPYLVKSNQNYLLVLPYLGYNTYTDFKLIRLIDLEEVNLNEILPSEVSSIIHEEAMFFLSIEQEDISKETSISFVGENLLTIGNYEFSCENLLSRKIRAAIEPTDAQSLKSLIPIKGNFFDGYSIEIHTIKSTLMEDGSFETLRTELGELIYKLKYNFEKSVIEPLAQKCANIIKETFSNIDVIIPVPPSNLNRPFQPVYELASKIGELTEIPVDFHFVKKLPTEQIKTISNQEDRNIVLDRAITIKDKKYRGKNILLFDDLFRSGDTLNTIAKKLKFEGEVNRIKALCVTKTRTKK
jgi:competence protein ComFC